MRLSRTALVAAVVAMSCVAPADAALHPGDKIDVTVYNHPELSGTRTLDASGNVALPMAGTISALNIEPTDLADRIRGRLAPYVRKVDVQVQLSAQNESVFVTGGPNGSIRYLPGMSLTSVVEQLQATMPAPAVDPTNAHTVAAGAPSHAPVDLANGPTDFRHVKILRDRNVLGPFDVVALRQAGQTGPALNPNDTVQLATKPIAVQVTGDVEKPGTAYLNPDEPLAQALNQVGGVATSSSQSGVTLVRDGTSRVVSLGNEDFNKPAENGDKLVVARAPRVDVLGEVTKPGETVLRGNSTLVSAIYYAGGPAEFANLKSVQLLRSGKQTSYDLNRLRKGGTGDNPPLQDGDVVFVPRGSTFRMADVWQALGSLGLFGLHL